VVVFCSYNLAQFCVFWDLSEKKHSCHRWEIIKPGHHKIHSEYFNALGLLEKEKGKEQNWTRVLISNRASFCMNFLLVIWSWIQGVCIVEYVLYRSICVKLKPF
jgi:hypothetical protein